MQKTLRIGIIGAGGMGQALAQRLTQKAPMPGVEVAALAEANQAKLEAAAGACTIQGRFTDHRTMLARADLDAVYISSPNYLHKQHALDAMAAGCHVFCEKPVALRAADAAAMLNKAASARRVFMVNFPMRFTPQAAILKAMISRGEFGEIYYAKAGYLRRRGVPGRGGWFTNSKLSGGGPLIDLGVHILDRIYWLMGAPEPVSVTAAVFKHLIGDSDWANWPPAHTRTGDKFTLPVNVEDLATALIRFKNGAALALEASWAGHSRVGQTFELFGTRSGSLENAEGLRVFQTRGSLPADILPDVKAAPAPGTPFEHFIGCIRRRRRPMAAPAEIINVCKIIEAVYQSAASGREVRL